MNRTLVVMLFDFSMAVMCMYCSLLLRHGSWSSIEAYENIHIVIILLAVVQSICFYFLGLYKAIWRFSSTPDLIRVFKGVSLAVLSSTIVLFFANRLENVPRTALLIDWLLLIVTLGGGRFSYRLWKDLFLMQGENNVLIVGAGEAGEKLLREIKNNKSYNMSVVGFIDDDPRKINKTIHGLPVLGSIKDLEKVSAKHKPYQLFISIPSASSEQMREIVKACSKTKIKFKTLPSLADLIDQESELTQLRNVEAEDLLGRDSVSLNTDSIDDTIQDQVVMVTGAGGSIGSELCNQICKFQPKTIILFELTELFLYHLEKDLNTKFPNIKIIPIIGDVRNREKVAWALGRYYPKIVFHAAAYKHVPLMEQNPIEAIKTNILGTKIVVEETVRAKVDRFVMISTDKAVNPTNIMGTTKRIAEIICQINKNRSMHTKIMVTRFGNVLGSSGSVIPLFKKQISQGGPITITHPNVVRFFMSIPEATQLVLQAGSFGNGGEIFVLEMGSPMKIVDLAHQMIQLAGLEPEKDIEFKYIGLRPGEKLYEELLTGEEEIINTTHPKLKIAKAREIDHQAASDLIDELLNIGQYNSINDLEKVLFRLVPEYTPNRHGSSSYVGMGEDNSLIGHNGHSNQTSKH
ncbi:polysaccharide biosynthesis protein [Bacteriovoracaceae bacterium]|nr:polysaccharide biosynthesis protein [Bacteriovoracaceae bacterium]